MGIFRYFFLKFVVLTSRIKIVEVDEHRTLPGAGNVWPYISERKPAVFSFWVCRAGFLQYFLGRRKTWMQLSGSEKNDWLQKLARLLGGRPIQGSIEGGGRHALLILLEKLNKGDQVALPADSSLGVPKQCKAGPFIVAQEAGVPIVPISWRCRFSYRIKYQGQQHVLFPLPFNRIEILVSKPVPVVKHYKFNELDDLRNHLKKILDDMECGTL